MRLLSHWILRALWRPLTHLLGALVPPRPPSLPSRSAGSRPVCPSTRSLVSIRRRWPLDVGWLQTWRDLAHCPRPLPPTESPSQARRPLAQEPVEMKAWLLAAAATAAARQIRAPPRDGAQPSATAFTSTASSIAVAVLQGFSAAAAPRASAGSGAHLAQENHPRLFLTRPPGAPAPGEAAYGTELQ